MTRTGPRHSSSRTLRLLLAVACAVVTCSALAPSANAGVLVKAAGNCATQPLERPFLRWLDPAPPVGAANWTIDDVYVDPKKRS